MAKGPTDEDLASPLVLALRDLLRETHLQPPDRIPHALDVAVAHLDARAVIFLADYGKELLIPFPGRHGQSRSPMSIDSTLAGRAFRMIELLPSVADDQPRLWAPIMDGSERIGVLELLLDDPERLDDPTVHRHAWMIAHYLGHLVVAIDSYGDAIDTVRRTSERSIEAEVIWQLLPPLTAGTEKVVVSGRIEPCYDVGGDVFDYALSAETADFAVIDATGHDLRAGLAAVTALAAYRNARRQGHGLFEQAESVHRAITAHFEDRMFATGVFGRIDLDTGRLRYVSAGHPPPLLMRRGRVVKMLQDGRRALLGVELADSRVGEEALEPDDVLVVYSDGFTEVRDAEGKQFGVDRLIDLLQRGSADEAPLPEVVRRVTKGVLRAHDGRLQDDATLLMVHWSPTGRLNLLPTPLR
jgi:hypothetical protein